MQNSYDQIPYPSLSYAQSHPDRLATLATLFGLDPTAVTRCRVLELGCASGGNLIPVAYALPESEFVGIDFSPRQIADAQNRVTTLGLTNVTLKSMNILDVTAELGQYDYIIAHGVYSWVPPEVRDKLLQICKQNLAPNGVAYVSYNTYPGWHLMGIIRETMLYHTRELTDLHERATQSRAMLDFLAESVSTESGYGSFLRLYASYLKGELKGAGSKGDALLLHDELEEVNAPVYFYQFVEHAAQRGLQYLVEAELRSMFADDFSPETRQTLQKMARNNVEMGQYLDFLRNQMFRQTLLCHDGITINRTMEPEQVYTFRVASRARPESDNPDIQTVSVGRFRSSDKVTLSTDHPVSKAAMLHLFEVYPRAVLFEDLLATARSRIGLAMEPEADADGWARDAYVLGVNLLRAYGSSSQLVELHVYQPPLTVEVAERPLASPVARLQAQESTVVTNLWHERVHLDEASQYLLGQLDGAHDRAALLNDLLTLVAEGRLSVERDDQPVKDGEKLREVMTQDLERHLRGLARSALLVG